MRLGMVGYYSGFFLYPAIAGAIPLVVMKEASNGERLGWVAVCLIGVGAWTLAEYFIHRYVLHHVPVFRNMHEIHHDEQTALVGTPFWMSSVFFLAGSFLPAFWAFGAFYASALTSGLMAGYFWYTFVHHAIHHWHLRHDSHLYRLKRRHAQHHYTDEGGNFGVTNSFWDRAFGTYIGQRNPAPAGH
jgi:sterol desaturase/sphingolipid hydroxylase (fatty acid hydroxylase superfamily)